MAGVYETRQDETDWDGGSLRDETRRDLTNFSLVSYFRLWRYCHSDRGHTIGPVFRCKGARAKDSSKVSALRLTQPPVHKTTQTETAKHIFKGCIDFMQDLKWSTVPIEFLLDWALETEHWVLPWLFPVETCFVSSPPMYTEKGLLWTSDVCLVFENGHFWTASRHAFPPLFLRFGPIHSHTAYFRNSVFPISLSVSVIANITTKYWPLTILVQGRDERKKPRFADIKTSTTFFSSTPNPI